MSKKKGFKYLKNCTRCGKSTKLKNIKKFEERINNGFSITWVCKKCFKELIEGATWQ